MSGGAIRVDFDGQPLEFPAGTDPAVIQSTIKRLAAERKAASGDQPKPLKIGAEGLPDAVKAVAGDFDPMAQLAVGAKSGWDSMAMRLKQAFGNELTPEDQNEIKANRALSQESNMALLGKLGFDVGATAGPVGAAYRGILGANTAAGGLIPAALAKTTAAGTVGAGTAAAVEPTLQGESTLKNMGAGGVGGMLADGILRGAGRLVQPFTASPKVQELLNRDIVPTFGQAADGSTLLGRMVKSTEEKLQSVPFLGDVIRNARARPHEEVNLAAIKTAYPDAKNVGHKGIQEAEDYVGGLYQTALGKFTNGVAPDRQFMLASMQAPDNRALLLSKDQRNQVREFIDEMITKKFGSAQPGGTSMTAEMAKKIDSEIGTKVRELSGSTSAAEKDMGKAFQAVQKDFRDLINRNAPSPEVAAELAEANSRWANFVRVRDAAASSGSKEGVFTPAQLQAAVRRGDASAGKGRFAQGEALMQDLSGPAKSVLGDTVANSGTADRYFLSHAVSHPFQAAAGTAALLPAAALYSRAGQRYMLGDLPGQGVLSGAMQDLAPYAASGGGILNQRRSWVGSNKGAQ